MDITSNQLLLGNPAAPVKRLELKPVVFDLQNLAQQLTNLQTNFSSYVANNAIQNKLYIDQYPSHGNYGDLEVNLITGVCTVSQLSYSTGKIQVYKNGILLQEESTPVPVPANGDFIEAIAPSRNTFTLLAPLFSTDIITAIYYL